MDGWGRKEAAWRTMSAGGREKERNGTFVDIGEVVAEAHYGFKNCLPIRRHVCISL